MGGGRFLTGKYPRPVLLIGKCQTPGWFRLRNENNTYHLLEGHHLPRTSCQTLRLLLACAAIQL